MVAAYAGRYPIKGHVKRDLSRRKGVEAMGIHQAWKEGISAGSGKRQRDGRILGRGFRDGQHSGEQKTPQ